MPGTPTCFFYPRELTASLGVIHRGMATDGARAIYVPYRDGSALKMVTSLDEGSSWPTTTTIVGSGVEEFPLNNPVAVDGKYIHLFYNDQVNNASLPPRLWYVRSTDNGVTWSSPVMLDDGTGVGNNRFMRLAVQVSGPYVHLLWSTTSNGSGFLGDKLSYRRSDDYGATWNAEINPFSGTTGTPGRPDMTVEGRTIHIAWTDMRHGTTQNGGDPYYGRSTDNGDTWGTETRMIVSVANSTARVGLASSGDYLLYTYQDPGSTPGSEDVYYLRSTDGGTSWGSATLFATGSSSQEHAYPLAVGSLFAVVYSDFGDTPHTAKLRYSTDYGATWTSTELVRTPSADSGAPLAVICERSIGILEGDASDQWFTTAPIRVADPSEATLLDDFNRANDSSPPPGLSWENSLLGTEAAGDGLVIVSNQLTKAATADFRQGGYWKNPVGSRDIDLVAEISALPASDTNGASGCLANRVSAVGTNIFRGYYLNIDTDTGLTGTFWTLSRQDAATGVSFMGGPLRVTPYFSVGDKLGLTCREDMILAWWKPIGGSWRIIAGDFDNVYVGGNNVRIGVDILGTNNSQEFKITNLWATDVTPGITLTRLRGLPRVVNDEAPLLYRPWIRR